MKNPLSLRLSALELLQKDGHRLSEYDKGTLTAARRSGNPELVERAAALVRVDDARRQRAKQRERTADDASRHKAADAELADFLRGRR